MNYITLLAKKFGTEYSRRTNNRVELGHVLRKGEMPHGSRDRQARAARQLDMRRPHRFHPRGLLAHPAGLSVSDRLADRLRDESVRSVAPKKPAGTEMAGRDAIAARLFRKCGNRRIRGVNAPRQRVDPFGRVL